MKWTALWKAYRHRDALPAIYFHSFSRPLVPGPQSGKSALYLLTTYLGSDAQTVRGGDYILHKEPKVDERMMYIYSVMRLSDRSARVPPATNTALFTQPVAKFIWIVLRIQKGVSTMEGRSSEQGGQRSPVRVRQGRRSSGRRRVHCERGVDGL